MGDVAIIQTLHALTKRGLGNRKCDMVYTTWIRRRASGIGFSAFICKYGDKAAIAWIEIEMVFIRVIQVGLLKYEGHAQDAFPKIYRCLAIRPYQGYVMQCLGLNDFHWIALPFPIRSSVNLKRHRACRNHEPMNAALLELGLYSADAGKFSLGDRSMNERELVLFDFPESICSQMARLVLEEKGAEYSRRTVDIMNGEQFEPWYSELNPKAVVPTLSIGGEIVTDTMQIVRRVDNELSGPALTPAGEEEAQGMESFMSQIMGLHYGVLLYSRRLEPDGTAPTILARERLLRKQLAQFPDRAEVLGRRIDGNVRMQAILADPDEIRRYIQEARELVVTMDGALKQCEFLAGHAYSLADSFATAALARFSLHGFRSWWAAGAQPHVADYYLRMRERPSFVAAGVVDEGSERDL